MTEHDDEGLGRLLDLNGWTAEIGDGYWVCMKARRVAPEPGRPHGIQYALTLHRPGGERILGYDNAHVPPIGTGPAAKSKRKALRNDHRHRRGRVFSYEFESAGKLLEDFWRDVDALLKEEGVS